ncbi:MAG: hypothetical protein VB061_08245 [Christensenella sp.]|nr:hypothetical protein [Christensenella sp.]
MLHYGYDLIGKNVVNFLFTVVPFIFVGASISVTKSLETYFQRFILITAAAVAMQIIGNFISGATYVHDMTASYSALPSAIIAIYFMFRNKKQPVYVVLNIVYFFEILYMGVRGPIGIYFVCLLISILYFTKTRKARIVTSLTFVICAALFMSGTIERWLLMANRQLAALGINNGALIRYLNGTIIGDNGRSVITEKVIYAIWEHPILGNGLFYDRVLLGDNNYAHNLITEVLMDFGIFFGTIVLVVIAVCLIKLFTSARKDPFKFMFLLSLTAASIGLLTLSGSYLENRVFFMLVGIMMNQGFYKESIKEIGMDSTCLAV